MSSMTTTTEQSIPNWQRDPRLVPVVNLLRRHWRHNIQAAVDRTDCFGLYVLPDEGPCDQASVCELASYCKATHDMAAVHAGQSARAPIDVVAEAVNPRALITASHTKQAIVDSATHQERRSPIKNKWADTDKYLRAGYQPCGRPVDQLLIDFKSVLPKLPELPLVWNAKHFNTKFARLGTFTIAATASYHTIMREGVVLCRFWTNTVKQAIVDILPELETPVRKASSKLGTFRYRVTELSQLEPPCKIPDGSWHKLRPCTHRTVVRTPDAAKAVARIVKEHWKIGN